MKLRTVTALYGRKWQTRQFESADVRVEVTYDLEEGDDPETAKMVALEEAKNIVRKESVKILAERKAA